MDFENLTLMSHLWNSRAHFSTDSVETRSKPCSVVLSHKRLDKFFSSYLGIALLFSHVMSPSSRLSWACIFECRYKSCKPSTQIDGEEGCQFPATTAKLTLLCPCFCFCVCVSAHVCRYVHVVPHYLWWLQCVDIFSQITSLLQITYNESSGTMK